MKLNIIKVLTLIICLVSSSKLEADIVIQQDSVSLFNNSEVAKKYNEIKPYLPKVSGILRGRYEWTPEIGASRFMVRTAIIGLGGNVTENISYQFNIDFCDRGEIIVLDAYSKIDLFDKQLSATVGQMRLPFSVDAKRSPRTQFFANRSFLAKYVGNVRDIGAMLTYSPSNTNLNIEAGVWNGNGLSKQTPWNHTMIYVGRINYTFSGVKAELGVQSQRPDYIRLNIIDASLSWKYKNLFLEGEYMNKHYTNNSFKTVHAYNLQAIYRFPLKKTLSGLSILGRWDSMTEHSNGMKNEEGKLYTTEPGRDRLTGGVTLSFGKPDFGADLRVNYEKYFYHDDYKEIRDDDKDKLVLELVVNF